LITDEEEVQRKLSKMESPLAGPTGGVDGGGVADTQIIAGTTCDKQGFCNFRFELARVAGISASQILMQLIY